jgi:multidrug efflux pump subunit AcrB/outer membrane protein TolC
MVDEIDNPPAGKSITSYNRTILFLGFFLAGMGILVFLQMPKQEDPRIQQRGAVIQYVYPGASPEKIESLVVRPVEDQLALVEELDTYEVEIRLNVAIFSLTLRDSVSDIPKAWREVERAIERAKSELPDATQSKHLDFYILDVESIVLAVTGSDDKLLLLDTARKLKDELSSHPLVARMSVFGDPGEEILIEVPQKTISEKFVSVRSIANLIQRNNEGNSSGFLVDEGRRKILESRSELTSLEDLAGLKIESPNLKSWRLDQISSVQRVAATPPNTIFRWNGKPAIGLGIVARQNIDVIDFGRQLNLVIEDLQEKVKPLQLEYVAFQPARSEERIHELLIALFSGIILISAFLTLTFGFRTALIVSFSVPAISLIGLFCYYAIGGVLHQISIAAFVISIGQFIDNIIVMVDAMKRKIAEGHAPEAAADLVFRQLRVPLFFATLTGICAFLPLLSAQGSTADFVFAFPLVAVLTLIVSYFFSIFFVPVFAAKLLRKTETRVRFPVQWIENRFIGLAIGPFWKIGSVLLVLIVISAFAAVQIPKEFFPEADRNEFVFEINLGASADILETDRIVREVEDFLSNHPHVLTLASFAGGQLPKFYYNLPSPRSAPQNAQILVTTLTQSQVKGLGLEAEEIFSKKYPKIDFNSYFLQQGPPVPAKIEIRYFSQNLERYSKILPQLKDILKNDIQLRAVRSDWSESLIRLEIDSSDARLADLGSSRTQMADLAAFESSGLVISNFRGGREVVPIRIRSISNVNTSLEDFESKAFLQGRSRDFALKEIAELRLQDDLALIRRENGKRFLRVLADLKPGATFDGAVASLQPPLASLDLQLGEKLEWGGDVKGAGEANQAVLKVVPLALLFLIVFLLLEFGSYRKVLISLVALPISILGVFPGLWIGGQAFGFMSLLGLIGLVGISINNIILLLDAMEYTNSLREAIGLRFRAILMTTILTLLGLMPLTLDNSSLWPPLGWTMISGLITGTFATLVVVPALYRILFRVKRQMVLGLGMVAVMTLLLSLPSSSIASQSIDELMGSVDSVEEVKRSQFLLKAENFRDQASFREAFFPTLSAGGELLRRNTELTTETPAGRLVSESAQMFQAQVELRWSVFDWSKMRNARQIGLLSRESAEFQFQHEKERAKLLIGTLAIEILKREHELEFLKRRISNLEDRRQDVQALIEKGRISESHLIQIDLDLERLIQSKTDFEFVIENQWNYFVDFMGLGERPTIDEPVFSLASASSNSQGTSLSSRSDVLGLQRQAQAVGADARRLRSQQLPKLDVFLRGVAVDGQPINQSTWAEAGVALRWEVFSSGLRQSQSNAIQSQSLAIYSEAQRMERERRLEVAETFRQVKSSEDLLSRLNRMRSKAEQNRRLEESRYQGGRISLRELVDADEMLLRIQRDLKITALDGVQSCLRYQFSLGVALNTSCGLHRLEE